ncbi:MAG: ParB/RepB/Spo0J family partition protein [Candidatus Schekmanbacteria bacterium]|nr:MAG: ParB/RepB/Spo0J family partition protein [Candidatus Schekmanbacteria bacterium]
MKRKSLGKGLDALISSGDEIKELKREFVKEINLKDIKPGKHQPRKSFDDEKMQELVSSIKTKGVIQPILVKKKGKHFIIIAGERRWRAAKKAGIEKIPAIVKDIPDKEIEEIALIENIQREDLNPIEEAEAYGHLMKEHNLNQNELASIVGKERSTIANYLRLLKLPEKVKQYIVNEEISMGHARVICGIEKEEDQIALAELIVRDSLSVRQTEKIASQGIKIEKNIIKSKKSEKSPEIVALEERLREALATKVKLSHNEKTNRGKIIIEYYSLDELDRMLEILTE